MRHISTFKNGNRLQRAVTWAFVVSYSLHVYKTILLHRLALRALGHLRVYDHTFQNMFLAASEAVQPLLVTIRNMWRCEKQLPLSNLEANLTASVITPLKFRKLFLQTTLTDKPRKQARQGWWQTLHREALCWVSAFTKEEKPAMLLRINPTQLLM